MVKKGDGGKDKAPGRMDLQKRVFLQARYVSCLTDNKDNF